jgi:transglutaminase-like putative cysteine protease
VVNTRRVRVSIQHKSRYVYPRPALLGPQTIRLRPAEHARARIESYSLAIAPEHRLHWQRDPHGNHIARVTFKAGQTVTELDITVELAVDVQPINPFDFFVDERVRSLPFAYPDQLDGELAPYLVAGDPAYRLGRAGMELLKELPSKGDTIGVLIEMLAKVRERIAYVIRNEPGVWTPEETLAAKRGSCRDSAVLLVALMRARGIAARFVSGYLVQLADEGMIPDEPKGVSSDVVDLHAWAEAYLPGAGWIGFDGTSGLLCGEGHIPLASTASPSHASPLDGTSDVGASAVEFSTSIHRLGHEVRPTAPYTDEVWSQLVDAGDRTDAALTASGLEVWIGGEPTFIAREGQTKEEWQGGAIGADKWKRGRKLADQLRDRLAPGGLILFRQGKVYPGESLPRWALDVIARRDGQPLWPARSLVEAGTIDHAKTVATKLAAELGIAAALHAAYEDPWEVLRSEAQLPPSIDPRTAGLDDPEERRRLAKILDRGVGREVGYVLPLGREGETWRTDHWTFRREQLFLIPGDSAIGLRLPLESLPAAAPILWADAPDLPDPRRDAPDDGQPAEKREAAPKAPRRDRRGHRPPHRARGRAARGPALDVPAAGAAVLGLLRARARDRSRARSDRLRDPSRGLSPTAEPRAEAVRGDAGSRRARGQPASRRVVARGGRAASRGVRGRARVGPHRRALHGRWSRRRFGRWQPHHDRWPARRAIAVAGAPESPREPDQLRPAPPVAVVHVQRHVRRAHVAGAAGRRSAPRCALRARARPAARPPEPARVAGRCVAPPLADRCRGLDPSRRALASTSCSTSGLVVRPPGPRSSCARSRCRRTRG